MENDKAIYTRDIAAKIVERFEYILSQYDIHIPSPEDDDRDEDDMVGLYGSTYYDLLDDVEGDVIEVINDVREKIEIIPYTFSGRV